MISIIVPIYNTAKYLSQCIDSILNQSYKNIEIILVNDASPDNSLSICESYSKKDSRIILIDKKINEGVDKARFTGLEYANGKYILFVDSDDWLENSDILSILYQKAEATNADYVEMGMQRVMDRHKWIKNKSISPVTGLIQAPELFDKYYISFFGINILSINIWGKLYRKSTLNEANITPSEFAWGMIWYSIFEYSLS